LEHGNPQEGKFCREVSSNIKSAMDEDKVPEGVAAIVSLRDMGTSKFQEPLTT
jgi:hypothetical protein